MDSMMSWCFFCGSSVRWLLQVVVILFFIPIPWEEFAGWTQCRTRPVADHWKTTVAARTSLLSCADHWCRLRGRPTHRSWGAVWCGPFDIASIMNLYQEFTSIICINNFTSILVPLILHQSWIYINLNHKLMIIWNVFCRTCRAKGVTFGERIWKIVWRNILALPLVMYGAIWCQDIKIIKQFSKKRRNVFRFTCSIPWPNHAL